MKNIAHKICRRMESLEKDWGRELGYLRYYRELLDIWGRRYGHRLMLIDVRVNTMDGSELNKDSERNK